MGTANVISMITQPVQASYLCFEIGGILDTCYAKLGVAVKDIPYSVLSDHVKTSGTIAGDPSRLRCDSNGVMQIVQEFSLATLRNEDRKAFLDSAVNTRQNIYFSKYANSALVISTIKAYYSQASPTSKPNRLEILRDIAQQQAMDLQEAYTVDGRTGVVRETSSSLETATTSRGNTLRALKFYQEGLLGAVGKGTKLHGTPAPWEGKPEPNDPPDTKDKTWLGYPSAGFKAPANTDRASLTVGVNYEESNNSSISSGTQSAWHVDYEYRTPYLEARARNNRAQISLMDQKFESYMFEQNIPHLEQIFQNELASVDNGVYQLQIALLRSFLISPLPGIVTGIYKNPGDAVNAGEPVIRVEDNGIVHLVANLVHHGPIPIGATATVTTTLSGAAGPATTLTGSVVAARGQGSGGRWEVIIKANNTDGSGNYILPLNYYFDAEYTQVTIV
jgi:hypothetical protein